MLGLGGAGRPFLNYFCWLFEYVFYVALWTALLFDFRRFKFDFEEKEHERTLKDLTGGDADGQG